jgi:D-lactate dehydrogenase (cytochrome)
MHEIFTGFASIVGGDNIVHDNATRAEFSQDLVDWDRPTRVVAVIRPANTQEVAHTLKLARSFGLASAPRGAGLSYTKGYTPLSDATIALDLSRLNRISELNGDDLYLTAEAGVTWQQVDDAAKSRGLRPVLRGPISGSHATIGGTASQGLLGDTDGFLGFEVVLADGTIVTTGAGACLRTSPFYRHFGPDITGLFSNDTGAFGVKTKVTLKLEKPPAGYAPAAFSFSSLQRMAEAIVAIGRENLVPRLFGIDPVKTRSATKIGLAEAGRVLTSIVASGSSVVRGLSDAITVARSGRDALDNANWSLHVHAEGVDDTAAKTTLERVRAICGKFGTEISPSVAIAMRARPYSIRGIVGLNGERFVPTNAMFPFSRAKTAAAHVEQFFLEHQMIFEEHQITTCCIAGMDKGVFLIEPMFYWPDEIGPIHRRYLPADKVARFADNKPNPKARKVVIELREKLCRMFFELGAVHMQVGKYYDLANAVSPAAYGLLTKLKQTLDPEYRLNPGNFGWSDEPRLRR